MNVMMSMAMMTMMLIVQTVDCEAAMYTMVGLAYLTLMLTMFGTSNMDSDSIHTSPISQCNTMYKSQIHPYLNA